MAFKIAITEEADKQLRSLAAREQRIIEAGILARLPQQSMTLCRAVKKLRPNSLAGYELRVGDFRVLYNVEQEKEEVILLVVGRKVGNKLIVGGEEFHGHESDPPS